MVNSNDEDNHAGRWAKGDAMRKQALKETQEGEGVNNKMTFNAFREMNLKSINEILDLKDRIIIISIKGDLFELRKMEF